jgi:Cytochrome c553
MRNLRTESASETPRVARAIVCLLLAVATASSIAAPVDTAAGAQIAANGTTNGAVACISCHGAKGEGMASFPRLGGTGAAYLQAQLDAFASGARHNAIMQPIEKALTPQQRLQVAEYFASLPGPAVVAETPANAPTDIGAWLATRGRWSNNIPACAQCHGPGGSGVGAHFPPLAGQPADYLAAQLTAWQANKRPPGPLDLMQGIARKLSKTDIQAVSAYYAKLKPDAAASAPSASTGSAAK